MRPAARRGVKAFASTTILYEAVEGPDSCADGRGYVAGAPDRGKQRLPGELGRDDATREPRGMFSSARCTASYVTSPVVRLYEVDGSFMYGRCNCNQRFLEIPVPGCMQPALV
jgi:hypothetical protein